ncbi:hypothetical protein VP01_2912g2 [Puccinia sorghi]|uniref:Uncharacterized protein n=1 Tax=Puccinia sorghi TaxID=27349 RepID=A0A0L6V1E7_9BASI|nr:hypothetical protein VP01_2912g2 [Puccinia sorghi]
MSIVSSRLVEKFMFNSSTGTWVTPERKLIQSHWPLLLDTYISNNPQGKNKYIWMSGNSPVKIIIIYLLPFHLLVYDDLMRKNTPILSATRFMIFIFLFLFLTGVGPKSNCKNVGQLEKKCILTAGRQTESWKKFNRWLRSMVDRLPPTPGPRCRGEGCGFESRGQCNLSRLGNPALHSLLMRPLGAAYTSPQELARLPETSAAHPRRLMGRLFIQFINLNSQSLTNSFICYCRLISGHGTAKQQNKITYHGLYVHPRTWSKHLSEASQNSCADLAKSFINLALQEFLDMLKANPQPSPTRVVMTKKTKHNPKPAPHPDDVEYKPIGITYCVSRYSLLYLFQTYPAAEITVYVMYLVAWLYLFCGLSQAQCCKVVTYITYLIHQCWKLPPNVEMETKVPVDVQTITKHLKLDPELKSYKLASKGGNGEGELLTGISNRPSVIL